MSVPVSSDILHEKQFSDSGRGRGQIEVFEKMHTGSPLLSSRRFSLVRFFRSSSQSLAQASVSQVYNRGDNFFTGINLQNQLFFDFNLFHFYFIRFMKGLTK